MITCPKCGSRNFNSESKCTNCGASLTTSNGSPQPIHKPEVVPTRNRGKRTDVIFISYRRDDSAYATGRLYDRLREHFGESNVFMDIDAIELGVNFREKIEDAVGHCDVLIAMMGKQWLNMKNDLGERRLDDPNDFVRLEILAALNRNIHVIPVLIDGASVPSANELPKELSTLSERNGLEIRHKQFNDDANRLIKGLDAILSQIRAPAQPSVQTESVFIPLKYYVYISETKIRMLLSQISQGILAEYAHKYKLDLEILAGDFEASHPKYKDSLYAKTTVVSQYLLSHEEVGSVASPKRYIFGTHELRWGVLSDYHSRLAFFGGTVDNTMLALIGSSASLIGRESATNQHTEEWHSVDYYTLRDLNIQLDKVDMSPTVESSLDLRENSDFENFATAVNSTPARLQRLEFLAKKLTLQMHEGQTLLVATPIYVSLEE